jgi:HAD superfamily hydrolase (TIGR01509 family)
VIPYDAILFDFDGVLVDSEPVHHAVWQEVLAPYAISLSWEEYQRRCIGVSDKEMILELCAIAGRPAEFDRLWNEYPRKRSILRERMLAAPPAFADSIALVHSLAAELPLAVVTSSARNEVEPVLDRMGILPRFRTCVFGEDVKRLKPDPEPYRLAAARLGVTRPLVIEDSAAGCASATAAGFEYVRVTAASAAAREVSAHLSAFQK